MSALAPFPAGQPEPETPAFLSERGFLLRRARDGDLPRLKVLYADTRADEMAGVPWPALVKNGFLDQQFELQHRHYLQHYADADFLVVEHEGVVQGRYYLQRTPPEHLLVDVCLMAAFRGRGLGRALIEHSLRGARARGCGMYLHVLRSNGRARQLYERLGFEVCDGTDTHQRMRWPGTEPAVGHPGPASAAKPPAA